MNKNIYVSGGHPDDRNRPEPFLTNKHLSTLESLPGLVYIHSILTGTNTRWVYIHSIARNRPFLLFRNQ